MEETENIGNLEIDKKEGVVRIGVNPKIYSMSVIWGAAHAFTKDNYVLLDGGEDAKIIVELKPMEKSQNLEELGRKFCNRLLSYLVYRQKMKENEAVRNLIICRALATNSAISIGSEISERKEEKNDSKRK